MIQKCWVLNICTLELHAYSEIWTARRWIWNEMEKTIVCKMNTFPSMQGSNWRPLSCWKISILRSIIRQLEYSHPLFTLFTFCALMFFSMTLGVIKLVAKPLNYWSPDRRGVWRLHYICKRKWGIYIVPCYSVLERKIKL
jgi:hypothetical protein